LSARGTLPLSIGSALRISASCDFRTSTRCAIVDESFRPDAASTSCFATLFESLQKLVARSAERAAAPAPPAKAAASATTATSGRTRRWLCLIGFPLFLLSDGRSENGEELLLAVEWTTLARADALDEPT
jgi:hypothetical protein